MARQAVHPPNARSPWVLVLVAIPAALALVAAACNAGPAPTATRPSAPPATALSPTALPPTLVQAATPTPTATPLPMPTSTPTPWPGGFRAALSPWPAGWTEEQRLQHVGGWKATLHFAPGRQVARLEDIELGVDPRCPAPPIRVQAQVDPRCIFIGPPPAPDGRPALVPYFWYPDNYSSGAVDLQKLVTSMVAPARQVEWDLRASFAEDLTETLTWATTPLPAGMTLVIVDPTTGRTLADLTRPGQLTLAFSAARPDVRLLLRATGADKAAPPVG